MAAITALALLVAIGLIVFQVNPSTESNERSIERQAAQLEDQQGRLQGIICAQAQTTANAFRFRSLTPSGEVETVQHFLVRILAQQQTLQLSRGLACKSAPGLPSFEKQVRNALKEIAIILSYYGDDEKPVSDQAGQREEESSRALQFDPMFPSYVPGSGRGVGEEGLLPAPQQPGQPKPKGTTPSEPPTAVPAGADPRPREAAPMPVETPQEPAEEPKATVGPDLPDVVDKVKDTVGKVVGQSVDVVEVPDCSAIRELHELC